MATTLAVTTVQTNLYWEDKAANLAMLEAKITALSHAEVVVLPEMFTTGFSMQPQLFAETMEGETVAWMRRICQQQKIILTGSLIIKDEGQYYNRLIWMLPTGQYGYYDKRHLFAYAGEHKHYALGQKRLVAQVKGWKILLLTCYDLRFPVWSRQQMAEDAPEYDAIIYVANWPERRSNAWRSLLVARAIENQCYVVGVNRVGNDGNGIYHRGDTMVVNAMGEVLYQQQDAEAVATILLDKTALDDLRQQLPFLKDGDRFTIGY